LRKPGAAKTGDFAIPCDLERIARDAVDPGIADLLRENRQIGAVGLDGIRDFREAGGNDLCVGKLSAEIGVNFCDLLGRVRALVIAEHRYDHGEIGTRYADCSAIAVVIHDDQRSSAGIVPHEQRGRFRRRARAVHADIEKLHVLCGERSNEASRVAGDVGHLGAGGGESETSIEGF
jgi:hypothetical protein